MTAQETEIAKKLGTVTNRNSKALISFIAYCQTHPDERFWQALRNWSEYPFVVASQYPPYHVAEMLAELRDTFYLETRRHDEES